MLDVWEFLGRNIEFEKYLEDVPFVLPNDCFFPIKKNTMNTPEAVFSLVKRYMGVEDWACELIMEENPSGKWDDALPLITKGEVSVGGMWLKEGEPAIVYYSSEIEDDYGELVATFSYELTYYIISTFDEEPPGGMENIEVVVDLAAVYFGFGVFTLQSSFQFRQDAYGWSVCRGGYLTESEIINALAVFLVKKNIETEIAAPYINGTQTRRLNESIRKLKQRLNV